MHWFFKVQPRRPLRIRYRVPVSFFTDSTAFSTRHAMEITPGTSLMHSIVNKYVMRHMKNFPAQGERVAF
jgi:hypothetical protein